MGDSYEYQLAKKRIAADSCPDRHEPSRKPEGDAGQSGWSALNRQRGLLIDKNIAGTITPSEAEILQAMQAYTDQHLACAEAERKIADLKADLEKTESLLVVANAKIRKLRRSAAAERELLEKITALTDEMMHPVLHAALTPYQRKLGSECRSAVAKYREAK